MSPSFVCRRKATHLKEDGMVNGDSNINIDENKPIVLYVILRCDCGTGSPDTSRAGGSFSTAFTVNLWTVSRSTATLVRVLSDEIKLKGRTSELPANGAGLAALSKKPGFHAELLHNVRCMPIVRNTNIPHRKRGHWKEDKWISRS